MSSDARPRELHFRENRHTTALVCKHVWNEGAPILHVSHDATGEWQFVCGGIHEDAADAVVIGLEQIALRDPSVNAVANMCTSHVAERAQPTSEWIEHDETLDDIRHAIDENGWWVGLFEEEEGEPAFAYTIGLSETFGHPEIIIFGLSLRAMNAVLNECGDLIRKGARFTDGASSAEVLKKGYAVRFRTVAASESLETYLGYGCRFYDTPTLPVLQCVWPDKAHKFPGEDGAQSFMSDVQPLLP